LALIEPWLRKHLAALDEAVTRRFVQVVIGVFEQRPLLEAMPSICTLL